MQAAWSFSLTGLRRFNLKAMGSTPYGCPTQSLNRMAKNIRLYSSTAAPESAASQQQSTFDKLSGAEQDKVLESRFKDTMKETFFANPEVRSIKDLSKPLEGKQATFVELQGSKKRWPVVSLVTRMNHTFLFTTDRVAGYSFENASWQYGEDFVLMDHGDPHFANTPFPITPKAWRRSVNVILGAAIDHPNDQVAFHHIVVADPVKMQLAFYQANLQRVPLSNFNLVTCSNGNRVAVIGENFLEPPSDKPKQLATYVLDYAHSLHGIPREFLPPGTPFAGGSEMPYTPQKWIPVPLNDDAPPVQDTPIQAVMEHPKALFAFSTAAKTGVEVRALLITPPDMKWTRVVATGDQPPHLESFSATQIGSQVVIIADGEPAKVWLFDTKSGVWSVPALKGKIPSLKNHRASYISQARSIIIVNGPRNLDETETDTFLLQLDNEWSVPASKSGPSGFSALFGK